MSYIDSVRSRIESIERLTVTAETYDEVKAKTAQVFEALARLEGHGLKTQDVEGVQERIDSLLGQLHHVKAKGLPKEGFFRWLVRHLTSSAPRLKTLVKKRQQLTFIATPYKAPSLPTLRWQATAEKIDKIFPTLSQTIGKGKKADSLILDSPYWAEAVDLEGSQQGQPFHLYQQAVAPYFNAWQDSSTDSSFEAYFHAQVPTRDVEPLKRHSNVRYLQNQTERAPYVVTFRNRRLFHGEQALNGQFMFVLSPDGETLYMGEKEKGHFQHSSFLAGGAVKSAGIANVVDGKIVSLIGQSGHYKPQQKHLDTFIKYLGSKNRIGKEARNIACKSKLSNLVETIRAIEYRWRQFWSSPLIDHPTSQRI